MSDARRPPEVDRAAASRRAVAARRERAALKQDVAMRVITPQQVLRRALAAPESPVGALRVTTTRTYSHFRAATAVYACATTSHPTPAGPWDGAQWLAPDEVPRYALTGATLQALRAIGWLPAAPTE